MASKVEVINNLKIANERCDTILQEEFAVGLDCEGLNLGHNGVITLVQIVNSKLEVFLFDIWTCPQILTGRLKVILQDPLLVKIIHACNNDRVNLKNQFGIVLDGIFDTQVAHSIVFPEHRGIIGWNNLCQKYNFTQNPLKKKFKKIFAFNHAYLKKRPMAEDMIKYATADVIHLHALYNQLNPLIKRKDREYFDRICGGQQGQGKSKSKKKK